MRFAGRATFRADGDCLLFTEQGTLAFAGYRGDAGQRHRFAVTGAAADVWFEDGRFFHALDLRQGRAVVRHACAPDLYEGRYRVYGCDAWGVTWRVAGPRKRQVIASRFWRAR
jgi:hypothetical protein